MDAGDCLFFPSDRHLWVVISDPRQDGNELLLVSITTFVQGHPYKDRTCLIAAGEHPFVTHLSCVNYADARVRTEADLERAIANRRIILHDHKISDSLLSRIRRQALFTPRMARDHQDILIAQGLVG